MSQRVLPPSAAIAWHNLSAGDALSKIESAEAGLADDEAARRLEEVGPNVIQRAKGDSALKLLFRQINDPLIYVLLASAALAMAMGEAIDGAVVLAVVVLNTAIGFVQELRAGKAIEALVDMVPQTATVVRGGQRSVIPAANVVPGDVVVLEAGDKVPADARLLSVKNLHVDESALTGESVPSDKHVAVVPEDAGVGDRKNLAFGGTLVTSGTGTAVVISTGAATELGRISSMLHEATEIETPLTRSMAKVGRVLTIAIVAVALLIVGVALLRGYPPVDAMLAGISLAVAAIPEGLPAIITISLAIGVQRMARRRAVIRKLPAVETLGSTGVICSDKTGTLTRNEMTVRALWTPSAGASGEGADEALEVTGVGYAPAGELRRGGASAGEVPEAARALLRAGLLCNDARMTRDGEACGIEGDPTEGALVVAAQKLGVDVDATRREYPRIDAVPFSSERQLMATLHEAPGGERVIFMKGAPEAVLGCAAIGEAERAQAMAQVERMAAQGMRVLAVASRPAERGAASLDEAHLAEGFALLGLEGMIDPPRPEAIDAIKACHEAGITVKMITGDHLATARAIGQQLGLVSEGGRAMNGTELARLSDDELRAAAASTNVFARVAPEHKLRLVRALQAQGKVVAMTGDGVNDAPALKQANIGVAMGITGTAVSKESADVVLTDDNFASIRAAVEEGRRVYDNLVKALAFVLPTNLGEALILLVAVMTFPILGGAPLMPITAVQILWVNLVATVALSLPLAFEAMEKDVMGRPPRDPSEPILSRFVLVRTAIVAVLMTAGAIGLFFYEYSTEVRGGVVSDVAYREAQTAAVTTVVLFQIFYVLNCRTLRDSMLKIGLFTNPWVYVGIGALLALQLCFVYAPFMHTLFGSAPLSLDAWVKSTLVAMSILPVMTAERWWRTRRARLSAAERERKTPASEVGGVASAVANHGAVANRGA
ncbi:cation-translocating P-type ATPase [Sorangium sp. So ce394]|uniref:cation-translocating P-type ATPase n=1 Tax=Sorangium sp. So ce394 TaxID=3133310 RepID=UPI003F5CB3C7